MKDIIIMLKLISSKIINNVAYSKAVSLVIIASALTAITSLLCKELIIALQNFPFTTLVIYISPLVLLYCIIKLLKFRKTETKYLRLYFLAAAFKIAASYCFIYYLSHSSLLNATVLAYTNSIFILLIYRIFYKSTLQLQNLLSLLICFMGIVIIVHPTSSIFDHYFWFGLMNGVFSAVSSVILFDLTKKENKISLTFSYYLFTSVIALLIAAVFIKFENIKTILIKFDLKMILLISFFAVLVISSRFILIYSYSLIERPSSVAPFFYTAAIFAIILDVIFYGNHPHNYTYIGGAVIIFGDLIMFYQCEKAKELKFSS